ncbi:hypothetical protein Tco_0185912 [Tanacetum coccineum]
MNERGSSAQQKSTVIRLRIPPRRSTRLTPPTPILTSTKAEDMTLKDTIQLSIAGQKSHDNLEAQQIVEKVKGTWLDLRSYKESLAVEKTVVVQPVNVIKEEEELAEDDYELRRRVKGKNVEEFLARKKFNVLAQHLQEVMEESLPNMVDDSIKELTKTQVPIYVDSSVWNYMSGHILHVHTTQASQASAQEQQYQLYLTMKDNPQMQHDDLTICLSLKIKFEGLTISNTPCRSFAIRPRDQDDPHDDAHPEGENSAKSQKTSEHGTYVFRESSFGQANESKPGPLISGNQEQLDDFDFCTDTYARDDDELPVEKVSQELVEEMSKTVDEAKLRKVVDKIKEILTSPFPPKPTLVVQSCQRYPKAPALSLVNQDLLYLKKGNSGPEKFVLSLHKFPAVIFPDDDIEERTSRWVNKCVKKFNPYAQYSVEHWKNPHAKIFYIKRQKEQEIQKKKSTQIQRLFKSLRQQMN